MTFQTVPQDSQCLRSFLLKFKMWGLVKSSTKSKRSTKTTPIIRTFRAFLMCKTNKVPCFPMKNNIFIVCSVLCKLNNTIFSSELKSGTLKNKSRKSLSILWAKDLKPSLLLLLKKLSKPICLTKGLSFLLLGPKSFFLLRNSTLEQSNLDSNSKDVSLFIIKVTKNSLVSILEAVLYRIAIHSRA